ncbi:MAG: HNH endonuclease, partial [Planctomycetes bacterium]|nr:HNH endonuclease [Planctomycetota bacterium]
MAKRPDIPAEIERQILVESGHRCATCGASSPLEIAHIIPWRESKQHRAEDLICLCANCHARADHEKWGAKTLREYKANPWVHKHPSLHYPPVVDQTPPGTVREYFSQSWPKVDAALFGREEMIDLLDRAWDDPDINIVSFVAWGGVGKTALVDWWQINRLQSEGWRGAERVFAWSFYSQGAEAGKQASADQFVSEALRWFGDKEMAASTASPWQKGERLAKLVRERRTLLLLDGMEPLQEPPGSQTVGVIKEPALQSLLRALARGNPGLCVVTTRLPVADLERFQKVSVRSVDLNHLSSDAGVAYLRHLGVKGSDRELQEASNELGNHALALTLTGRYLAVVHEGDIRRRDRIPYLTADEEHGGHARRAMACYEQLFLGKPELQILQMLGLFDRPAEPAAIEAVRAAPPISSLTDQLAGLTEAEWQFALKHLRDVRLLANEESGYFDCHPLVREHFGQKLRAEHPQAWREGHNRLYEYCKALPEKDLPDTLEEMAPLFLAVAHGCQAGRHQEALGDVYRRRIQRGNAFYSKRRLGAFGAELAALSGFFEHPWSRPVDELTDAAKGFVLNEAGSGLQALGRLAETVQPFEAALQAAIAQEQWTSAAIRAGNLSDLFLHLGNVARAREYAEQSVKFADESVDAFQRSSKRTALADALHQAGRLVEAEVVFREAEAIQKETQPEYPLLYSLVGFQYCDLILARGACREVQQRAAQTLEWAEKGRLSLLTIALDHLTLGRALLLAILEEGTGDLGEAAAHLEQAVDGLREAGVQDCLARGLLARAELHRARNDFPSAQRDLDEAYEIATRGGVDNHMRLYECDCHLECCRLILAMHEAGAVLAAQDIDPGSPLALYDAAGDPLAAAREHLQRAAALI